MVHCSASLAPDVLFSISRRLLVNSLALSDNRLDLERALSEARLAEQRTITAVESKLQTCRLVLRGLIVLNILVSASSSTSDSYLPKLLSTLTEQVLMKR